jgi:hypothetical protein
MAISICRFDDFDYFGVTLEKGIGWRRDYVMAVYKGHNAGSPKNKNWLERVEAGWPLISFRGERWTIHSQLTFGRVIGAPQVWYRRNYVAILPYQPQWAGLLGNTLLYASAVGLTWFIVFTLRRLRRARTGRCIACGYALQGIAVNEARCPECGTPQKARFLLRRP